MPDADDAAASAAVAMTTSVNSSPAQQPQPEDMAMTAPYNAFVVPVYGFITPALIALTLITNCAVCAVLLRPHMRSPTNVLLVAIATSDMLTG